MSYKACSTCKFRHECQGVLLDGGHICEHYREDDEKVNYIISQEAYEQIHKMHPHFWQTYDCASVDDGVISYAPASQYMKEEPTEYKSEEHMNITTDRNDIASIGEYIKHKKRVRKVIGYAIGDDGRDCYVSAAIDDDYGWRTHLTPVDEVTHKYIRVPVCCDAE